MREKQRVRPPQGSIIDKLIEEALFEFTSLKEDGAPSEGAIKVGAASPLNSGQFVDPTNWAEEIAIQEKRSVQTFEQMRHSLPGDVFEQGNLSALEEDPMPGSSPQPQIPAHASSAQLGAPRSSPSSAAAMRSGAHAVKSAGGSSNTAIGLVLFLVVAAAAGAAWFSGLIPHR